MCTKYIISLYIEILIVVTGGYNTDLTVYNTSDKEVLCAHDDDRISTHRTLTCTKPVIGRYVHFKRTGGTEIQQSILCEVVIIGHNYIDCTLCPRDVACSEVTGCEECNGSYQPDCKEGCEVGFYGTNCKRECGHCKDGKACDRYHGGCSNGCEIWWTDTTCNTYIGLPNHRNESVTVIKKTTDSIQIKWQHIGGISPYLGDFYGYLIQYKADTVEDDYTEAVIVKYNSDPSWTFDNLKSGTEYWIEIKPFREYEGMKEFGTAYKVLGVNTECEELHSPSIMEAAILGENNGFIYILITYKNISPAERFCDQITKAMLYYKLKGSTNYQFINVSLRDIENIIKVKETGEYEIKLVAQNEEGNTFSSKIHTFLVTGKSGINIGTIVLIILIVLFGMTTILLVILLLKSRINVGKERQNKHEENVGNTEMRTEATNPGTMSIESDGKGLPEQCSCEVTEHVASTEDSSINNEDFYEQNNVVVQYEDVMPTVKPKEDDQNQYEGLSPGAGRVYENRMIEGPYAEIRK